MVIITTWNMSMLRNRPQTGKQELFAHAVADGKSLADSYRQAYSAERMSKAAVRVEASRLFARPNVTLLVEELKARRDELVDSAALSDKDKVLDKLRDMMTKADAEMVQLRAAELLGKTIGLFKDVIEQPSVRNAEEIRRELRQRLDMLNDDDPELVH